MSQMWWLASYEIGRFFRWRGDGRLVRDGLCRSHMSLFPARPALWNGTWRAI